jgi:hypothetical protein
MANLRLDIVILPTYNSYNIAVVDASYYPVGSPPVVNPSIQIDIPGFNTIYKDFATETVTVYDAYTLGICNEDCQVRLPDGIYHFKYTVNPAYVEGNSIDKTIMRVDKLQEKFDELFMRIDILECDPESKRKAKEDLDSIYLFIQGSIAAANNCAAQQAERLYNKADSMLDSLIARRCGCFS